MPKKGKKPRAMGLTEFLGDKKEQRSVQVQDGDEEVKTIVIDRKMLPSAPRAALEDDANRENVPHDPPFTAFMGNLPYDIDDEDIRGFFRGLAVVNVKIPTEDGGRMRGFALVEFDTRDNLIEALSKNEETLKNRTIKVNRYENKDSGGRDGRGGGGFNGGERGPPESRSDGVDDWRGGGAGKVAWRPKERNDAGGGRRGFGGGGGGGGGFGGGGLQANGRGGRDDGGERGVAEESDNWRKDQKPVDGGRGGDRGVERGRDGDKWVRGGGGGRDAGREDDEGSWRRGEREESDAPKWRPRHMRDDAKDGSLSGNGGGWRKNDGRSSPSENNDNWRKLSAQDLRQDDWRKGSAQDLREDRQENGGGWRNGNSRSSNSPRDQRNENWRSNESRGSQSPREDGWRREGNSLVERREENGGNWRGSNGSAQDLRVSPREEQKRDDSWRRRDGGENGFRRNYAEDDRRKDTSLEEDKAKGVGRDERREESDARREARDDRIGERDIRREGRGDRLEERNERALRDTKLDDERRSLEDDEEEHGRMNNGLRNGSTSGRDENHRQSAYDQESSRPPNDNYREDGYGRRDNDSNRRDNNFSRQDDNLRRDYGANRDYESPREYNSSRQDDSRPSHYSRQDLNSRDRPANVRSHSPSSSSSSSASYSAQLKGSSYRESGGTSGRPRLNLLPRSKPIEKRDD